MNKLVEQNRLNIVERIKNEVTLMRNQKGITFPEVVCYSNIIRTIEKELEVERLEKELEVEMSLDGDCDGRK